MGNWQEAGTELQLCRCNFDVGDPDIRLSRIAPPAGDRHRRGQRGLAAVATGSYGDVAQAGEPQFACVGAAAFELDGIAVMHGKRQRQQAVLVRRRMQGWQQQEQDDQASHGVLPQKQIVCDSMRYGSAARTDAQ